MFLLIYKKKIIGLRASIECHNATKRATQRLISFISLIVCFRCWRSGQICAVESDWDSNLPTNSESTECEIETKGGNIFHTQNNVLICHRTCFAVVLINFSNLQHFVLFFFLFPFC